MAAPLGILGSRVARRVLLLFVVGALVPVAVMAAASFRAMTTQLRQQSEERLRQVSKNARQAVMQQLILTEAGVRLAAEALKRGGSSATPALPASITGLAVTEDGGLPRPIMGDTFPVPLLLEGEKDHLRRGDMVMKINFSTAHPIMAVLELPPEGGRSRTLWAGVEGDSIWGAAERFASGGATRDFCVVAGREPLYCQSGRTLTTDAFLASGDSAVSGTVVVPSPEGELIIGHAELFLEAAFAAPPIRVLVTEAVSDLYGADLALFRYSFGVALALGLLMVVLLATIQVRRTMTPLDALTEGTVRLAEGDLSTRVSVSSGDEFETLAASFNGMAQRLGVQFQTMEAGRAIDRAVLSAMDRDGVVDALLGRFDAMVPCSSLAILILKRGTHHRASLFWRHPGEASRSEADVVLSPYDLDWIGESPDHRVVEELAQRPPFLVDAIDALGPSPLVVLPMTSQEQLLGAVVFETLGNRAPDAEVIRRGRQVADQAAVALDAVRMVGELEETNLGALRALARSIDAKSRWTAGHSERVTELSLRLGRALGLSAVDLDILHRGGLLHDVGKIGVPARLLDHSGVLTKEDWDLVREHPIIGGRILEPIRALAPALPIVRQHHERWDGKGYPFGLVGTQIHHLARVLTVVDTYDAMASARPYRVAMDTSAALAEIRRSRGTQFEPRIVDAFLEMMAEQASVLSAVGQTDA